MNVIAVSDWHIKMNKRKCYWDSNSVDEIRYQYFLAQSMFKKKSSKKSSEKFEWSRFHWNKINAASYSDLKAQWNPKFIRMLKFLPVVL